jgi:orotate phosphoribosyltransferase
VSRIENFKQHLLETDILDPIGIHHEFSSGMHGRKLDFDRIETHSELYNEWIDITTDFITQEYPMQPKFLIGVANGTNRVSVDTANKLGGNIIGLDTEKDINDSKIIHLTKMAKIIIEKSNPEFVLVVEDVGSTGSNSVQVASESLLAGARQVEILNTWQRRAHLEKLLELGIPYKSIIKVELPTFEPIVCELSGYCSKDWQLIKHD